MHREALRHCATIAELAAGHATTEATYYAPIAALVEEAMGWRGLPFEVRANTGEARPGGGADVPDLALYDGPGDFAVVLAEVKLPSVSLDEMAASTDRNDQIGRYLAQTPAVLLCNIREIGLLTVHPAHRELGPVPPEHRVLEDRVALWPSEASLLRGEAPDPVSLDRLADLLETAVTRYAPIAEPESLARVLARLARRAKDGLPRKFTEAVRGLLDDFAEALGMSFQGEEGEEFLRSSLVQTAFYGLFAAWTLWRTSGARDEFRWEDCADHLRIPFLGGLFHEFRNPSRMKELGLRQHLDHAEEALARVDADRFFARFRPSLDEADGEARCAPETRAILYFYEPFLESFDPELRKRLGVWYTPEEIVRYQVRNVDRLLRDELGCPTGFADERVVVLDPCCGTGAYLVEVLRCIAEELDRAGAGALSAARLREALCERVIGFEILTAPFVIAHLQVYLMMAGMGVAPDDEHRPAIFLTNALTGWEGAEQLKLNFPELQEEHDAARRVKTEEKIIVILGNPPYDRWTGVPMAEEADLVDHYKGIRRDARRGQVGKSALYTQWGVRKHLLDDLYIRFFRLAEMRIGEHAPHGVVSFISNSSYLTGRSHPIMRESLLRTFDAVWVDRLNGDKYATGKVIPKGLPGEGASDQSVFTTREDRRGIQVGTAVITLLKRDSAAAGPEGTRIQLRDFWGRSDAKRAALLDSLEMEHWSPKRRKASADRPEGPRRYESYQPSQRRRWLFAPTPPRNGYDDWVGLDEAFPVHYQGVNPNRGLSGSLVDHSRTALERRMREYFSDMTFDELSETHPGLCAVRARYRPADVRTDLIARRGYRADAIVRYVLFPLDARWIYYEPEGKLLNEARAALGRSLLGNAFLVATPGARRASETRPLMCGSLFDLHLCDWGACGFPVHVVDTARDDDLWNGHQPETRANLSPSVWKALKKRYSLEGDLEDQPAKDLVARLFHLVLAICHSAEYQDHHATALTQDWARIPVPDDPAVLAEGDELGTKLATLLDPLADAGGVLDEVLGLRRRALGALRHVSGRQLRPEDLLVTLSYFGAASGRWTEREPAAGEDLDPAWGATTGDLFLNDDVYLANVPPAVWRYELGGYPVVKKWLGYRDQGRRPGEPLSLEEAEHLTSMIQRIAAALALAPELDAFYERAAACSLSVDDLLP